MKKEIIIIYIVVALIAMFFISQILKRLGILKSQAKVDREKAVKEIRQADYWNPLYYKDKVFKPMAESELKILAGQVRKSVRFLGTNEELLYSTFKKLMNKCNVSQLSEVYYNQYKRDLQTDIMKDLNNKEKEILLSIINNLPNF